MPYTPEPFNINTSYPGQVKNELSLANTNFTVLGQAFFNNDPTQPILRATYIDTTAPTDPVSGSTWLDTSTNPPVLKVYDGNDWQVVVSSGSGGVSNSNTGSEIISPLSIPYSRLYIDYDPPSNPNVYDSFYSLDYRSRDKLYYYDGATWVEVDWTKWVQNDPWYIQGRLSFADGYLKIKTASGQWRQIYPTIGRVVELAYMPLSNYPYSLYLTVGQSLYLLNKDNYYLDNIAIACIEAGSQWKGYCASENVWATGDSNNMTIGLNIWDSPPADFMNYSNNATITIYRNYTLEDTQPVNFIPLTQVRPIGDYNAFEFSLSYYNKLITTTSTNVLANGDVITTFGYATFPEDQNNYTFQGLLKHVRIPNNQSQDFYNYSTLQVYHFTITRTA
jgi:hypothetical protein